MSAYRRDASGRGGSGALDPDVERDLLELALTVILFSANQQQEGLAVASIARDVVV